MKTTKTQTTTKLALLAGATALAALAPQSHAQSSDALIEKLVSKGILTVSEAKDLREESDKDFKTAFQAKCLSEKENWGVFGETGLQEKRTNHLI